jgi:hypothetical protein
MDQEPSLSLSLCVPPPHVVFEYHRLARGAHTHTHPPSMLALRLVLFGCHASDQIDHTV